MFDFDRGNLPEELIDRRGPWDELEPEDCPANSIRGAQLAAVRLLNAFASSIEIVLSQPNCTLRDVQIRFYALCFGIGLSSVCEGRSMSEIADALGCERATISKTATEWCRANSMDPSFYMKKSAKDYANARVESIERNNARLKGNGNGNLPDVPPRHRSA